MAVIDRGSFARATGGALLAAVLALTLTGCEDMRQALGMTKRSPDEMAVIRHAPLVVPPDYDLRPPTPGAPRPMVATPRDRARNAVLGQNRAAPAAPLKRTVLPGGPTPGERALLSRSGASDVPLNIREVVRVEAAATGSQDRSFADNLLFWKKPKGAESTPLDPVAERERLRQTNTQIARAPVARPPSANVPVARPPGANVPVARPPGANAPVARPPGARPPVAEAPVAYAPGAADSGVIIRRKKGGLFGGLFN